MNVIFWNSDAHWWRLPMRTIGPYKIKHWIKKWGYTSQVIDFVYRADEETLYELTTKWINSETLALAISTTYLCNVNWETLPNGDISRFPRHIISVVRRIKQDFPHIKIILGGHVSDKVNMEGLADATTWAQEFHSEDIFLEYLNYLRGLGQAPLGRLEFNFIDSVHSPGKPRK